MTTATKARILTIAVLGGALVYFLARRPASESAGPQSAIYGTLDAARAGDVRGYLDCYSGPTEASLRQTVRERGEADFRRYLKEWSAAVKGVAVSPAGESRFRVEYVFEDRNEAQTVYVERAGDRWRIAQVGAAERVASPVPYGASVK